jgi:hypothetical protein
MVPDAVSTESDDSNPVLNAVVGGIAGILLAFVPLSPILGGGIAGYLQGGPRDAGLKVGLWAGLVMLLPYVFIGFFLLMLLGFGGTPAAFGLFALIVIGMMALYTVGLSALGGYLGTYLHEEL